MVIRSIRISKRTEQHITDMRGKSWSDKVRVLLDDAVLTGEERRFGHLMETADLLGFSVDDIMRLASELRRRQQG